MGKNKIGPNHKLNITNLREKRARCLKNANHVINNFATQFGRFLKIAIKHGSAEQL